MSQNSQTHFKYLAAFTAKILKYVWTFWDSQTLKSQYSSRTQFQNYNYLKCQVTERKVDFY